MIDLGDVVPLSIEIRDDAGALADGGTVTLTVTLPDGTSDTPTVSHDATGKYSADYVTEQAGRHVVRWLCTGANASSYRDVFDVAPAESTAVISLARAKDHLNITVSTYDDELRGHIQAATRVIEHYCGPVPVRTITGEYVGVCGVTEFALRQYPVVSVTSITPVLVGPAYDAADWTPDPDTGVVRSDTGRFIVAPVRVTYKAGRTVIPPNLLTAAEIIVKHLWETQRGGTRRPGRGRSDDAVEQQLVIVGGYAVPRRAVELLVPDMLPGVA